MRFLPVRRVTQAAVVVSLVTVAALGAVGFAHFDKSVNLSVDGKTSAVHVFGGTDVAGVLADQDITVGPHDVIAPGLSTPVDDGQKVVVRYGRLLTVTVDGQTKEYWTTSTTVAGALSDLGIRADSAKLSVSRSQPLGRAGLAMSVTTPKDVTVAVDGRSMSAQTTGATVADVLSELNVTLGAKDRVSPALTTPVTTSGTRLGEFETCKALLNLVNLSILKAIPPSKLAPSAQVGIYHFDWKSAAKAGAARLFVTLAGAALVAWVVYLLNVQTVAWADSDALRPFKNDAAQRFLARYQVARLEGALQVFRLENGQYPEKLEDLLPAGLAKRGDLKYPWTENYYYRRRVEGGFVILPPVE